MTRIKKLESVRPYVVKEPHIVEIYEQDIGDIEN